MLERRDGGEVMWRGVDSGVEEGLCGFGLEDEVGRRCLSWLRYDLMILH